MRPYVWVYNNLSMSIFAHVTSAPTPKTKDAQKIAITYAVVLVVMVVAQLFTFNDFSKLVTDFGLPGGVQSAHFLAAFLVFAEVFALPFLLRMQVSPDFRWLSMILGWVVVLIWGTISPWLVFHEGITNNVGFLGTVVQLMPGWWAVFISIALGIVAAWASWGMWPYRRNPRRVTTPHK